MIKKFKLKEQKTPNWTNKAVGILIYCFITKRFLLVKRSGVVEEPNTYNIISGRIDNGENPLEALKKEIDEEINRNDQIVIYPKSFYIKKMSDFTFYYYFGICDNEFTPKFNDENASYMWIELKDFTKLNLHFGMYDLLKNISRIFSMIKKYARGL